MKFKFIIERSRENNLSALFFVSDVELTVAVCITVCKISHTSANVSAQFNIKIIVSIAACREQVKKH